MTGEAVCLKKLYTIKSFQKLSGERFHIFVKQKLRGGLPSLCVVRKRKITFWWRINPNFQFQVAAPGLNLLTRARIFVKGGGRKGRGGNVNYYVPTLISNSVKWKKKKFSTWINIYCYAVEYLSAPLRKQFIILILHVWFVHRIVLTN